MLVFRPGSSSMGGLLFEVRHIYVGPEEYIELKTPCRTDLFASKTMILSNSIISPGLNWLIRSGLIILLVCTCRRLLTIAFAKETFVGVGFATADSTGYGKITLFCQWQYELKEIYA